MITEPHRQALRLIFIIIMLKMFICVIPRPNMKIFIWKLEMMMGFVNYKLSIFILTLRLENPI